MTESPEENKSLDVKDIDSSEAGVGWYLTVRLIILFVALVVISVAIFFLNIEPRRSFLMLYLPIGFLFGVSVVSALWMKLKGGWSSLFLQSQLLVDVFIITGIIYVSGGATSPFLFLYLPLVMASAIFFSRASALQTSILSSLAYAVLVWSLQNGNVVPFDGAAIEQVPRGGLFLQWLGLSSAMILVSVATSFLTRSLSSSRAQVEDSKRSQLELLYRQSSLLEGVPEGVVATESDGTVASMNQAVLEMFGLTQARCVGRDLENFWSCVASNFEFKARPRLGEGVHEFALTNKQNGSQLQIRCHIRAIKDSERQTIGKVILFEDVTRLKSIEEQLAVQERMARLLIDEHPIAEKTVSNLEGFVGESKVMQKVFSLIDKVCRSEATVLIGGESGTGKELVAKAIHMGSDRASKPFVPVNCGAIPETLIESELFGHKRGAFTGAISDHPGLFQQAEGGTIFLDEIGELPLQMQAKLLRAIQERSVRPVGSESSISVDVRILAATNQSLRSMIEAGTFREDLYYRLNVINITLPALRERKEDLPLLVNTILTRLSSGDIPVVTPRAMQLLLGYSYPGNVRELENILERALVMGEEVILPEHLPESVHGTGEKSASRDVTEIIVDESIELPIKLDDLLQGIEKKYLQLALNQTDGAKKRAAQLLGMNFRSFRYRLQKFGLNDDL